MRLGGDVVNRPGKGVAPVQGVLGAFHHLDPGQVNHAEVHHALALKIDAVQVDAHILETILGEIGGEPANRRRALRAGADALVVTQPHSVGSQVFHSLYVPAQELIPQEGRD